jgi:multidrug efflux pump subunit AcrB
MWRTMFSISTIASVFLFLRDWRATLIAAVALPLSVFPTFWAMSAMGCAWRIRSCRWCW